MVKKGGDGVVDMRAATGFHGKVFIDTEFAFFKALGAKVMGVAGFVNPRVLAHSARAYRKGFSGDTRGEGTQLGGLIVAGPVITSAEDDVSIIYLYREMEWGGTCVLFFSAALSLFCADPSARCHTHQITHLLLRFSRRVAS